MSDDFPLGVPLSPELAASNGSPTPVKIQRQTSPLPPVNKSDALSISKRRKLEFSPSNPTVDSHNTPRSVSTPVSITPAKQRNASTLPKSLGRRTPSLQDRPIPVLSPPRVSIGTPKNDFVKQQQKPINEESHGHSPEKSLVNVISMTSKSAGSPRARAVTSPLILEPSKMKERQIEEHILNKEISTWKRMIEVADRAQKYQDTGETEVVKARTDKWREAAQEAANMLYDQLSSRISDFGGVEAFKRQVKEEKFALEKAGLSFVDGDNVDRRQQEQSLGGDDDEHDHDEEDDWRYCMKYLLKQVNVDFGLVFPE